MPDATEEIPQIDDPKTTTFDHSTTECAQIVQEIPNHILHMPFEHGHNDRMPSFVLRASLRRMEKCFVCSSRRLISLSITSAPTTRTPAILLKKIIGSSHISNPLKGERLHLGWPTRAYSLQPQGPSQSQASKLCDTQSPFQEYQNANPAPPPGKNTKWLQKESQ